MATENDDTIKVEGVVLQALRDAKFKVQLENEKIIDCHVSGKIRKNFISILPGDKVMVVISKYDLNKGRIVFRVKG
jgi:translation initiation factor IF-1